MLVTKAKSGVRCKNERSNSSASTTIQGDSTFGNNKLVPKFLDIPPKKAPQPWFVLFRILATIVLTVVLPCVPETAIPLRSLQTNPNTLARFNKGIGLSLNHDNSLCSSGSAGVKTASVFAGSQLLGIFRISSSKWISIPSAFIASVSAVGVRS